VAMDKVEFHHPVHVGDLVSFYTEVLRKGRTSVSVRVCVEAERRSGEGMVTVTSADVTFVNVNSEGRPVAIPD